MTDAQAAVLERHDVVPDPSWTWVQASLAIDFATGAPVGRQAGLWLRPWGPAQRPPSGSSRRRCARPRSKPRRPRNPPAPAIPPMTDAQRTFLEDRGAEPDPSWTWVQASLAIDVATGAPIGRQATEWLVDQGYAGPAAERIIEEARAAESTAPTEAVQQTEQAEAPPAPEVGALPPGATPVSDMLAQIEADRARREAAVEQRDHPRHPPPGRAHVHQGSGRRSADASWHGSRGNSARRP